MLSLNLYNTNVALFRDECINWEWEKIPKSVLSKAIFWTPGGESGGPGEKRERVVCSLKCGDELAKWDEIGVEKVLCTGETRCFRDGVSGGLRYVSLQVHANGGHKWDFFGFMYFVSFNSTGLLLWRKRMNATYRQTVISPSFIQNSEDHSKYYAISYAYSAPTVIGYENYTLVRTYATQVSLSDSAISKQRRSREVVQ